MSLVLITSHLLSQARKSQKDHATARINWIKLTTISAQPKWMAKRREDQIREAIKRLQLRSSPVVNAAIELVSPLCKMKTISLSSYLLVLVPLSSTVYRASFAVGPP